MSSPLVAGTPLLLGFLWALGRIVVAMPLLGISCQGAATG